ncbi:hypothetical protein B5X24_HaOG211052 [Helicoverpa armigera]|uniref:Uncharacterized protein n=1 Tax=Helicoverpa armigera TaxID=29058 RepID=A0A2W1BC21_HELAM|nr:hypothetical protein B5X24_HaOG211052 [Helicoverpa armigera]
MEPALVSAWRALDVRPAADYRPPPGQAVYSLAQLVSEQFASAEERHAGAAGKHDAARECSERVAACGGLIHRRLISYYTNICHR